MSKTLTAAKVRAIRTPGKYTDKHGLILRVAAGGSKQWIWRGTIRGKRRDLGLGAVDYTTLAEAREIAWEFRRLARQGGDPSTLRYRSPTVPTFEQAADAAIAARRGGWRDGGRSEAIWRASLQAHIFPAIGSVPVDQISTGDLARALLPIWHTKSETARKIRHRIGAVMSWVIAEGHRVDDPTGAALTAALPHNARNVRHHKSLPYSEVAAALAVIDGTDAWVNTKACLRFVVATACRSGESRHARWDEIDRDAETWTIPAERSKTGRPLAIPLSKMALAALDAAYVDGSGLLFPSANGKPLSDATMSKLLKENNVASTVHGMRSSFRSWCADTGVSRESAELALGHVTGTVERAYQRSDLLEARREIMGDWSDYLG